MLKSLLVTGLLLAGSAAGAAVYAPSFAGPGLDPTQSFSGDTGFSYAVGGGTVSLFKAGGVTKGESIVVSDFAVIGDFDARLTLSNAANLGSSRFFFAADLASNSALALGFVSRDSDFSAPSGLHRYGGKPVQASTSLSGSINLTDNVVELRLRRSNGWSEAWVGDNLLRQVFVGDAAIPAVTFNFGLINAGLANDLDAADRAAFVSNFTVTTPELCGSRRCVGPAVPEPASWALLITGFGLTGTVLRRRRRQPVIG